MGSLAVSRSRWESVKRNKMSNVFTKRSGLSKTTTLSDFSNPSRMRSRYSAYDPPMPRVLSPTRRHNPHSSGLIYQSAYNRYSQCFGIWHPKTGNRKSQTTVHFPHLKQTNFSCRHNPDTLIKRVDASDVENGIYQSRPAPVVRYSTNTIQRSAFQWPKSLL